MKGAIFAVCVAIIILFSGCVAPPSGAMDQATARAIAESSPCMAVGNLTGNYVYNNNTATWWFDLDTVMQGCSPACVVYESNQTADVNYRCTGAMPPRNVEVKSAQDPVLGGILVDGSGYALYLFTHDSINQSNCYGQCEKLWPPLYLPAGGRVESELPGTFGTITRNDGTLQVTYNGIPLYYWINDTSPGDTYGQGFGNVWFVVRPETTEFPKAANQSVTDSAKAFCGNANVSSIYTCGEYVRVVSSLIGGGSTFYKEGVMVAECPLVAPDSQSEQCRLLLFGSNCIEKEVNCTLTESEALDVAVNGSCKTAGNVTGTPIYNENSETWWFDLDTVMSGCSPACVVYKNGSSEVNYRCTGLSNKTPSKPIVQLYEHPNYGEILTDAMGRSLYAYSGDSLYNPTCTSECIRSWPPLVLSSGYTTNVTGLPGTLSTVVRSDGLTQVTYNGIPLYRYVYDEKQGDVRGQGVNFNWFVVTSNMTEIPASTQPKYSGSSGGGSYY